MATQRTFEHILNFSRCLIDKGYDGYFLSTFGFNDKIRDNLIQHVMQCLAEKRNIGPFNLSTYSRWEDGPQPYVRCNFFTHFREPGGFDVMKMHIDYGNRYGVIRSKELLINMHAEIPTRDQANALMLERKKGLKI